MSRRLFSCCRSGFSRPGRPVLVALVAFVGLTTGFVLTGVAVSFGSSEAIYVVRPGDSLWSIAQTDGISMASLAAANDMVLTDVLLAGRTLVIPTAIAPGDGAGATGAAVGAAVGGASGGAAAACATGPGGPYGVLPAGLVSSGASALAPVFDRWAQYYGVSAAVVEAIAWQESGWQQGVVSPAGAIGIGQLLPATATFVSGELIGEPLDVYSVNDNVQMSTRFVAYLAAQEGGNLCDTIAAYYEGPGNLAAYGILPRADSYVADVLALLPRFE